MKSMSFRRRVADSRRHLDAGIAVKRDLLSRNGTEWKRTQQQQLYRHHEWQKTLGTGPASRDMLPE